MPKYEGRITMVYTVEVEAEDWWDADLVAYQQVLDRIGEGEDPEDIDVDMERIIEA